MTYKDYIDLGGFERIEFNDSVEFDRTGYNGFALKHKVGRGVSIEVYSGELDRPKLFIKVKNEDRNKIIILTDEQVRILVAR